LDAIRQVTLQQEYIRGRALSEIIHFRPGMSERSQERLMETLENSERHWPARRKHMFFQIFMAQHICRDAVEIHWANGNIQVIRPVRGISINGEAQGGIRPPYWVILAFCRSADGRIICSEGYAHALYQLTCPVPVDSKLERNTLTALLNVASWLKRKPGTPELSLERPLFDTEVYVNGEKKYVLPDFIVTARAPDGKTARVVIETMGYEDSDYCARKSRQHTGMKQIGVLHTDPPKWLDNEHPPFKKHMYGVFMHLRY
ncbi:protein YagA, partial [Escherichia coli]|nr:protein YagA [Escherichia coli]